MKRCPQCSREYDPTMTFCLDDGAELLYGPASDGPASMDEPQTAILPDAGATGESPTRTLSGSENETTRLNTDPPGGSKPRDRSSRITAIAVSIGALVIAALGFGGYWFYGGFSKQIDSIAVMPFVNESGNSDIEYLSDGMTETLISSLSGIPDVSVKARSTVFFYKGKEMSAKALGEELGVQAVLLGRVSEREEDLKLSLELVNTATQDVIWSQQYNRRGSDIVALQREIARDVSNKLKVRLSGSDQEELTKTYTANPEAYRSYLQGRFYWNKRDSENLKKAIGQFQAAVDRDPDYALAYVGLADSYNVQPWWDDQPAADALNRAKRYAERALEIDGSLGEAHVALAYANQFLWNWREAEDGYKRGMELSPNYASGHKWYGEFLWRMNRNDEAKLKLEKAYELEPLSVIVNYNLGAFYCDGQKDLASALKLATRIKELNPGFAGGARILSCVYLKQGRNADALAEMKKAVELTNRQISWIVADLGLVYAESGQPDDARKIISELESKYAKQKTNACEIAWIYLALGEKERALEWLEKDVNDKGFRLVNSITADRYFGPLKSDPRYQALLERLVSF